MYEDLKECREAFEKYRPVPDEIYFNMDYQEYLPRVVGDVYCDIAAMFTLGLKDFSAGWNSRPDGWVKVEDRLPPYKSSGPEEVLCFTKCGATLICLMDYEGVGGWVYKNMKRLPHTVEITHWRPLPPGPEGK